MNPSTNYSNLYGEHETQDSEDGEAHLIEWVKECKKNPGHRKFIPFESFTAAHLPESYRDELLYTFVRAAANLTVRIDVKMTSPNRPDFWPNSDVPYPFHNLKNRSNLRIGSGRVWRVTKYTDGIKKDGRKHCRMYETCPCKKCKSSSKPSTVWWEIVLRTAAHVVFDDAEAEQSTCKLFFDDHSSSVITLDDVVLHYVYVDIGFCRLTCYTCDEELADKLYKMEKEFNELRAQICAKYENSSDINRLTFIISHPHGCPKHISIGQWVDKFAVTEHDYKFTYTAETCPGSSGAPVYMLGYSGRTYYHVHSGALQAGLNVSGADLAWE